MELHARIRATIYRSLLSVLDRLPRWLLNYELARTDNREQYLQNKLLGRHPNPAGQRPHFTGLDHTKTLLKEVKDLVRLCIPSVPSSEGPDRDR